MKYNLKLIESSQISDTSIQKWFERTRAFSKQSKTTTVEQSPLVQIKEVNKDASVSDNNTLFMIILRLCLYRIVLSNVLKLVVWIMILFVHHRHQVILLKHQQI